MNDVETPSSMPAEPLGRRRIWVVVLLSLISSGLPFVYCGNLRLGVIIEIAYTIIGMILISLIIVFPTLNYLLFLGVIMMLASIALLIYSILYARRINRETPQIYSRVWLRIILVFFIFSVVDEIGRSFVKTSLVEAYKIPSGSMENTLLVGDYMLANKAVYGARLPVPFTNIRFHSSYSPQINDIIVFTAPGQDRTYVKRCIATEGQTVEIINKQLFVDRQLISMPPDAIHSDINLYPHHEETVWKTGPAGRYLEREGNRDNMPPLVVPEGKIFVLGDNRDNSLDSRFYGCVDCDQVLGKVMMIHWSWSPNDPCDTMTTYVRQPETSLSRPWTFIRCFCFHACHFYERVRWSRIGLRL
jgi:signal peptidase I